MTDALENLKAAAEAATPGPWCIDRTQGSIDVVGGNGDLVSLEAYEKDTPDFLVDRLFRNGVHIANMDPKTTLALIEGWRVMGAALPPLILRLKQQVRMYQKGYPGEVRANAIENDIADAEAALARAKAIAESI